MSKEELLNQIKQNPELLTDKAEELSKQMQLSEMEQLLSQEFCDQIQKVKLHQIIIQLMQPHFPQSLPLFKQLIDRNFQQSLQFQQTLILEYLTQTVKYHPDQITLHITQLDQLVTQLKDKDSNVKLVKAQTLQIYYNLLTKNLQKAKSLLMSTRAQKIRLPQDVQRNLDFISGCVMLYCLEYGAAAGYFSEGQFHVQQCLCSILQGDHQQVEKIVTQTNKKETTSQEDKEILLKIYQLSIVFQQKKYLSQLKQICTEICKQLDQFEIKFALEKLIENEVQKSVLKILKPYSKIQIEYLSQLTELNLNDLNQMLTKLIINNQLDYIIDGASGCLMRNIVQQRDSERFLKEANELVEALGYWL